MVTNIVWITTSQSQLRPIIGYLASEYSINTANKFMEEIDKRLQKIWKYPEIGRLSPLPNVRFFQIKKRYNFCYRVQGSTLYVLYIWDTKRNPRTNPFREN